MVKKRGKKETILVLGAHSDDFVIGAGGTIAKYVKEGKKVVSVVFSYGEKSHPWMKEKVVQKFRSEEASRASSILGCKTIFFDLGDQEILKDYKKKNVDKELLKIINRYKPTKIFTHSIEDSHLSFGMFVGKDDHKAVNKIALEVYDKLDYKPEVYVYSIWTPIALKTDRPVLYVDISNTFKEKINALKQYPSQRFTAIYPLLSLIYFRAFKNGIKIRKKFAEKFYRIK